MQCKVGGIDSLINILLTLVLHLLLRYMLTDTPGFFSKVSSSVFPFITENGFNFLIASAFAKIF